MKLLSNLSQQVKGIALMAIAVALIAVMNMFSKLITDYHDPVEKVFYRGGIALLLIVVLMIVSGRAHQFKTQRPLAQLGRGFAGTIGLGLVFWAYSLMPMTEVTALMFTGGFMTLLISPFILGEHVGPYRWGAVAVGFLGAIVIAQPAADNFNALGVAVSLGAAFCGGALVAVFLRALGKTDPAFTTVFYFLLIGLIMTGPYMVLYGSWVHPQAIWPLLGMGIAGGVSLIIKTQAYRLSEASLLTPVIYTGIIWAVVFDLTIWGTVPSLMVLSGAAVIIFANLVILWREHVRNVKHEEIL